MCNEEKYNDQTSYPQDQLGYTTKYANAIEKFINEAAEKRLDNADGFRNSLGGRSGTRDLADALAGFAYAATAPRHEWSFTINYYYNLLAMDGDQSELWNDIFHFVSHFECWPRPEEVGYVHNLDDIGFNQMWMSGSTDGPMLYGKTPFDEYSIGYGQHWCFDEGGYNLTLSSAGVLSVGSDHTVTWSLFDFDLTPVHVSMTIQLADRSWVHQREMEIKTVPAVFGNKNGVSINLGQKVLRCHVHTVVRASVSG